MNYPNQGAICEPRRRKGLELIVIYFENRAGAYNLLLAFKQSLELCSLKVGLLSIKSHNNYLEELLFTSVSSIVIEVSPFEGLGLARISFKIIHRKPIENFLCLCFYIF